MPSYNTGKFIKKTIDSVIDQTYENWELIIVDDCSTDNTDDVVSTYTDSRIQYFKNPKNSGAAISRNTALKKASGQWIAFLDSDDLWMPEKLQKQIEFMEKNKYSFSYTKYCEIDEEDNPRGVLVTGPKHITKNGMYSYCWPGCLTVMYDKEVVGDVEIADIKKNNDYAMWLKVIRNADCWLLDECLGKYRKRSGSISNHSYVNLVKWHYRLFKEAEGYNSVISMLYTIRNLFCGLYKKLRYVQKKEVKVHGA